MRLVNLAKKSRRSDYFSQKIYGPTSAHHEKEANDGDSLHASTLLGRFIMNTSPLCTLWGRPIFVLICITLLINFIRQKDSNQHDMTRKQAMNMNACMACPTKSK
ncbi:jg3186 [Pararge aegeria aegeria]|uniref:Jg3186 protein n=1 Tax=Pararge aegeria aegeria TaxID=348720 RepID=A0A8S4QWT8_9NEOP|nr:jg3186 [Pararge aegeria aegeria]